jgi:anti-anti-sigma regulatory factor
MKYTINENIIFFKESLSLENITELKDVLESELDSLGTHLQFDMQEVTSLDTAVLQYFLCLKRNLLKNNKNLEFVHLEENLLDLLNLVGLEQHFLDPVQPIS